VYAPPDGKRSSASTPPTGVGASEVFGQYVLHEPLGRGAMATVRRAELRGVAGFRRVVALKQLHPHLTKIPEMVELFAREARLGSYLRHANIAQTFDFGSVDGVYLIAMEFVRGPTLAQLARQCASAAGPIPMGIVLGMLIQLCDAFDYIHNACDPVGQPLRMVHCDVSPTNIIIANTGFVKLIDFGIARAASMRFRTETGMLRSRLAYVAPEYARGVLDARSDLFSLGVIGYELIANQPLFAGGGNELSRVREMPIPPLSRAGPVPRALQDVIMTALERDPDRRWQSAAAMRSALAEVAPAMAVHIGPRQVASWVAWAFSRRMRPEALTPLVVVPAGARSTARQAPSGSTPAVEAPSAEPLSGPTRSGPTAPIASSPAEAPDSASYFAIPPVEELPSARAAGAAELSSLPPGSLLAPADPGLVLVSGPDQRTLVVLPASACDPTTRVADVRPATELPAIELPATELPAIEPARTTSDCNAFQDAPTKLRYRDSRPVAMHLLRLARARRPRTSSLTLPWLAAFTREVTKRFRRPGAPRRSAPEGSVVAHPPLRRNLAHTVPRGMRTVDRLRGALATGTPPANPAVQQQPTEPIARDPIARVPVSTAAAATPPAEPASSGVPSRRGRSARVALPLPREVSAPAELPEPARESEALRAAVSPAAAARRSEALRAAVGPAAAARRSEALRAAASPAAGRTSEALRAPRPDPAAAATSIPRRAQQTTGVVVVPPSGQPSRKPSSREPVRGTRLARFGVRLPRMPGLAVFATLVALVVFALAYLWLRP